MARTHTQINVQKNTHAQMPLFPCHQTQHASAPRIRVCVRSMANKQLLDTQVSLQPYGGPKQFFVRDEPQPFMISQCQPTVGERRVCLPETRHQNTHWHIIMWLFCRQWSSTVIWLQLHRKNIIHMFCVNAWVASSSFCFLVFSPTRCLSAVLFMWLTIRNGFWE